MTTPQHVEKVSRRERWKRDAWMFGSTIISMALSVIPAVVLGPVLGKSGLGVPGSVAVVATIALWLYIDIYHVFPWGFERFDLVRPWQFREQEATES